MNIKDIFSRKKTKENELLDVPKVVFEDLELQLTIGKWLGIIPYIGEARITKKANIPVQRFEEITTKFGLLLKSIGINNSETCIFNQFNKNNLSFNCYFNNSANNAKISLKWGGIIDFESKLIIDYPNENKTYVYYEETKDEPASLKLQHYTIKNSENGNSYYRFLSPYFANFNLTNGEYSFSIKIDVNEFYSLDEDMFRLPNEEQLQQYLLGLTFPLEINEAYNKICEISTNSVGEYSKFEIEIGRKIDKRNYKETDLISLKYGQLNKFTMTKSGKTISLEIDDNCSYDSSKTNLSISINEVSQEVERVRKLMKTMLKNKEN